MQITEHRRSPTFCRLIDAINEWTGRVVAWLFILLTLLVMMDVFTRYVLKNPWYYLDVNIHIMGTLILLGGGYAFLHGNHIGVDTIVSRFSPRSRTIIELILFPISFTDRPLSIFLFQLSEQRSLSQRGGCDISQVSVP